MTIYLEAGILAFSAVIGGMCSFSDIRRGIIPNRVLLIGLAGGVPFHLAFLLSGSALYYPTWLINMLIADALAFVMYYNRLWAAGDAKLFIVLYYLFPPPLLDVGLYTHSVVPYIFIIPGCCDCVYMPYCGVCPATTYATENDIMTRTYHNYRCATYKGILDTIFRHLRIEEDRKILESWVQRE